MILFINLVCFVQIPGGSGDEGFSLEVKNSIPAGGTMLHKLKCTKGGNTVWEQLLSSQIIAVAGSRYNTFAHLTFIQTCTFSETTGIFAALKIQEV